MEDILHEVSELAIQLGESVFTKEQRALKWLGYPAVSEEEIETAENRLGLQFPKDYKDFLLITNGFFTPRDSTEPTFEKIDKIDHLKNVDPFLFEIWNEEPLTVIGKQLDEAIVIAGINDEQYFLLIPPCSSLDQWQYWKFANWIPGEQPYENLEHYFKSALDSMKS